MFKKLAKGRGPRLWFIHQSLRILMITPILIQGEDTLSNGDVRSHRDATQRKQSSGKLCVRSQKGAVLQVLFRQSQWQTSGRPCRRCIRLSESVESISYEHMSVHEINWSRFQLISKCRCQICAVLTRHSFGVKKSIISLENIFAREHNRLWIVPDHDWFFCSVLIFQWMETSLSSRQVWKFLFSSFPSTIAPSNILLYPQRAPERKTS